MNLDIEFARVFQEETSLVPLIGSLMQPCKFSDWLEINAANDTYGHPLFVFFYYLSVCPPIREPLSLEISRVSSLMETATFFLRPPFSRGSHLPASTSS